jgi:predicted HD phosphohydrolase
MDATAFVSVDELVEALLSVADEPSEDVVPALPHLLQTAERLESAFPDDLELTAAGLVHDIASALGIGGDHARIGSRLVAPLLGPRVGDLVAGHTDAKRYLVTVEPSYARTLSSNSTYTLGLQGGAMSDDELVAFRARADCEALIALRRADDQAKVPGRSVRPVAVWHPLLMEVARTAVVERR